MSELEFSVSTHNKESFLSLDNLSGNRTRPILSLCFLRVLVGEKRRKVTTRKFRSLRKKFLLIVSQTRKTAVMRFPENFLFGKKVLVLS